MSPFSKRWTFWNVYKYVPAYFAHYVICSSIRYLFVAWIGGVFCSFCFGPTFVKLLTVFVLTKLTLFPATVQHQRILSIISTIIYFTIDSKTYLNAAILAIFLMTVMKNVHSGTIITTCKVCNNKMTILRRILDLPALYRLADPLGACSINVFKKGK